MLKSKKALLTLLLLLFCCFTFLSTCNGQTLRNQKQLESAVFQSYSSPKYGYYDLYYLIIPKNALVKVDVGSSDSLTVYFKLNSVPTQTSYDDRYECRTCYFSNTYTSRNSSLTYQTLYIAVAAQRNTYYSYGITGYTFPSDYLISINSGKSITSTILTVGSWAFYQIIPSSSIISSLSSSDQSIIIERGLDFGFEFYSQEFPSPNYSDNTIYNNRLNDTKVSLNLGSRKYIAVVNRGKNQTLSTTRAATNLGSSDISFFEPFRVVVRGENNERDHYPFETYKFSIATTISNSIILDGGSGAVNSLIIFVYFIPFLCCCVVCGCCCFFIYRIKRSNY
ncbi:predicted protein [Naegleria gruberi]|uniref:Predicted protein n=1 Tax=Naegleria gruberi TaxID=5762 RepID=D2VBP7_NAEGR|nr:uncharacterized protein NAEGRDRAFT_66290 [Naegleria gruberi]EFC45946.1 predicted protein [Naegleria gruberi]|eukprot:XP_002678690.1 predicted protein [Naegleria gruberi strain NEG-M]